MFTGRRLGGGRRQCSTCLPIKPDIRGTGLAVDRYVDRCRCHNKRNFKPADSQQQYDSVRLCPVCFVPLLLTLESRSLPRIDLNFHLYRTSSNIDTAESATLGDARMYDRTIVESEQALVRHTECLRAILRWRHDQMHPRLYSSTCVVSLSSRKPVRLCHRSQRILV